MSAKNPVCFFGICPLLSKEGQSTFNDFCDVAIPIFLHRQQIHEIGRKDHELNTDPKHQRNAEHPAEDNAAFPLLQEQNRRRQIGQPVHDQQCDAGEGVVLIQVLCQGQYLKIRQHCIHTHGFSAGVQQHPACPGNCADADKQCLAEQPPPGDL